MPQDYLPVLFQILIALGFAVSTGSACSSGSGASDVLMAMGVEGDALRRVLRFSGGWDHSLEDWLALAQAVIQVGAELHEPRSGVMNFQP